MILFKNYWFYFCMFLVIFFYGVYRGVQTSNEQIQVCESKGGIPQTERGMYLNCAKPDNFIDIGAKQ